jgi:quercetin dioxygenase-like cupin family protein
MDRTAFETRLRTDGFGDIVARDMDPDRFNPEHTHDFDACGLITAGEFTLTCGGAARTYRAGEVFEMAAGTPHSERCGAAGASYVVGRRHR